MSDLALPFVALVAAGAAYGFGVRRAWARAGRGRIVRPFQAASFAAGVVAGIVALAPPLEGRVGTSLTAHMVQHVLLFSVVAPLLALGAPVPGLLWALPDRWRERLRPEWRAVVRSHAGPGWAWWAAGSILLSGGVMWLWHAPVLYQAALRRPLVHGLQHLSFVLTATLFWWAIAGGRRSRFGTAVLVVFVGALPGTALGAAMLLARNPWYPNYAAVHPGLADQQMAGVVMWAFSGLVYVVGAVVLFAAWLSGLERETPGVTAPRAGPWAMGGSR